LKSQKFTWPLAYVYISFVKLKNICSWFFPVLFKKMIFFRFFMIFHVLLHFWKKYSYLISFLKKNIHDFQDFSCFIQNLEWCFITFFLKAIHVLSMIFIKFSRFFKIFHVLFKILNDIFITFYKENIHVLLMILMNFSRFFQIFHEFSRFFMILFLYFIFVHHFAMIKSCISPYYYNCFHITPYLKFEFPNISHF